MCVLKPGHGESRLGPETFELTSVTKGGTCLEDIVNLSLKKFEERRKRVVREVCVISFSDGMGVMFFGEAVKRKPGRLVR